MKCAKTMALTSPRSGLNRWRIALGVICLATSLGGCANYSFQFANTARQLSPADAAEQARIQSIYIH